MKRVIKYFFTLQFALINIISFSQKISVPVVNSVNCGTVSSTLSFFPPLFCNDPWQLIPEASDEFNGNQVDLSKWAYTRGAVIDPCCPEKANGQVHAYTLGSASACPYPGDGTNGDLAYYTFGNNHEVSNGTLKFFIKQENIIGKAADYAPDNEIQTDGLPNLRTWEFTSGSLVSRQKYSEGKYEILCKLPKIDGLWPGLWLYGEHEQEIDILESGNINYNEDKNEASKSFVSTTHRNPTNPFQSSAGGHDNHCHTSASYKSALDLSNGFHTYSVEWDIYEVIFKIDGNIVYQYAALMNELSQVMGYGKSACNVSAAAYFHLPDVLPTPFDSMNIILGCGVQNFCSPQNPLYRGIYPATMEIDYIRVYKRVQLPPCDAEDITVTPLYYLLHFGEVAFTAKNTITTSGNVLATTNQTWRAGNYIELNDGFETASGANITFEIGDCDASNLRIVPNNDNTPIILQSTATAGKNISEKETKQEMKTSDGNNNSISPNPSSGIFTLMSANEVQNIEVRDMLGNIVYKQKINNNSINMDIDLSSQPKGVYILQVQSADKVYTEKIIIQ